jgi:hypothetical protein
MGLSPGDRIRFPADNANQPQKVQPARNHMRDECGMNAK